MGMLVIVAVTHRVPPRTAVAQVQLMFHLQLLLNKSVLLVFPLGTAVVRGPLASLPGIRSSTVLVIHSQFVSLHAQAVVNISHSSQQAGAQHGNPKLCAIRPQLMLVIVAVMRPATTYRCTTGPTPPTPTPTDA